MFYFYMKTFRWISDRRISLSKNIFNIILKTRKKKNSQSYFNGRRFDVAFGKKTLNLSSIQATMIRISTLVIHMICIILIQMIILIWVKWYVKIEETISKEYFFVFLCVGLAFLIPTFNSFRCLSVHTDGRTDGHGYFESCDLTFLLS